MHTVFGLKNKAKHKWQLFLLLLNMIHHFHILNYLYLLKFLLLSGRNQQKCFMTILSSKISWQQNFCKDEL